MGEFSRAMMMRIHVLDRDTWQRLHVVLGTSHCRMAASSPLLGTVSQTASTISLASDSFSKPRVVIEKGRGGSQGVQEA